MLKKNLFVYMYTALLYKTVIGSLHIQSLYSLYIYKPFNFYIKILYIYNSINKSLSI